MIRGTLDAPMLIGSGEDEISDSDIILDTDGTAFLPGSSLAGVLRSYLSKMVNDNEKGKQELKSLFGSGQADQRQEIEEVSTDSENPAEKERQSRLYVYDTWLEQAKLIKRDGVRLNKNKTAEESAKYDCQAVERETAFTMRLEVIQRERELEKEEGACPEEKLRMVQKSDYRKIKICIAGLINGEIRVGARSKRGFGKLGVHEVRVTAFDMMCHKEYKEWLFWDWDKQNAFGRCNSKVLLHEDLQGLVKENFQRREHRLRIPLKITNTLLIRQYSGVSFNNGNLPDSEMLQAQHQSGTKAVIPGSTWAGAFRSRLACLLMRLAGLKDWEKAQRHLNPFFGTWLPEQENGEKLLSSRVIFEESVVSGGHKLPITRNSIDRFTGGPVSGALFTECVWVGGETELVIRWPVYEESSDITDVLVGMLLWVAEDLKKGLLSIGGEGGVGRGLFNKNGDIFLDEERLVNLERYQTAAVKWCKKQKEAPR